MTTLRRSKQDFFSTLKPQSKKFWTALKYLRKSDSSIPCLVVNGCKIEQDEEKAQVLNKQFYANFNHSLPPLDPNSFKQPTRDLPENLRCTEDEVFNLLSNLDTTKANGPDGISAKMLKATAETITPSITMLFNISIKNCELPYDWKLAHVTPIPKSNDKSDPLNYRPISLLSILVKLLEKHMYSKILEQLKDISFLSNKQWGFTKGKSTTGALLNIQSVSPRQEVVQALETWRSETEGTYSCLRETLNKYSVFTGRNPLVSGK